MKALHIHIHDAFSESKIKRSPGGQFSGGTGSGAKGGASKGSSTTAKSTAGSSGNLESMTLSQLNAKAHAHETGGAKGVPQTRFFGSKEEAIRHIRKLEKEDEMLNQLINTKSGRAQITKAYKEKSKPARSASSPPEVRRLVKKFF